MTPDEIETHRIRHYAGLCALHIGMLARYATHGLFWDAGRNREMVDEALLLIMRPAWSEDPRAIEAGRLAGGP